jgi:hypothetical protein
MVLDWKYTVHLTPFEKVDDKHGLKTLIATSRLAIDSAKHGAMSERSRPCSSLAPTTEVSESMQADYSQAMNYISAPNSEDERYQDEGSRQALLEIDEKGYVTPDDMTGGDTNSVYEATEEPTYRFNQIDSESGIESSESSMNGPSLSPFTEYGRTTSVNKRAFPKNRQRSESVPDGFMWRRKGRRSKSVSRTTVSFSSKE